MRQTQTSGYPVYHRWDLVLRRSKHSLWSKYSEFLYNRTRLKIESVYKGIHVVFEESGVEYQGELDLV
jgi:hypothetical protein